MECALKSQIINLNYNLESTKIHILNKEVTVG